MVGVVVSSFTVTNLPTTMFFRWLHTQFYSRQLDWWLFHTFGWLFSLFQRCFTVWQVFVVSEIHFRFSVLHFRFVVYFLVGEISQISPPQKRMTSQFTSTEILGGFHTLQGAFLDLNGGPHCLNNGAHNCIVISQCWHQNLLSFQSLSPQKKK